MFSPMQLRISYWRKLWLPRNALYKGRAKSFGGHHERYDVAGSGNSPRYFGKLEMEVTFPLSRTFHFLPLLAVIIRGDYRGAAAIGVFGVEGNP